MTLKEVSPQKVLAEVAGAIPAAIHPNVVIIGSLAAGYWLFQRGDQTTAIAVVLLGIFPSTFVDWAGPALIK